MRRTNSFRQRGAFLIEGLIAIAVFSIGITAILALVGKMVVASGDAQYRTQAAQYAETILSDMRTFDPTTMVANFGSTDGDRYKYWNKEITAHLPLVGASAGTQPLSITTSTSLTGIVTAVVTIQWRSAPDTAASGGSGVAHSYVTTTSFN